MKIRYQPICELQLQHGYYADNISMRDFRVHATPSCQHILNNHRLVLRKTDRGFSLYGQVDPSADPVRLMQALGEETPKLTFWLEALNPLFVNVSDLPAYQPGREIFYFNNLSDQRTVPNADSPLFLGDSVSGSLLGNPLGFITRSTYTFQFATPVSSATLTVSDLFNNTIHTISINEAERVTEHRLNLDKISGLLPGRYVIADNHGKSESLYVDSNLNGRPVFGLIELYNTTTGITADHSEQVPAAYRFLSASGELTNIIPYTLKLNSRATTWRYIVIKKYNNNGVALNELSVLDTEGTVNFNPNPGNQQVTFTADTPLPLREVRKPMELHRSGNKLFELPIASPTPLQKVPAGFSSDIYVYV